MTAVLDENPVDAPEGEGRSSSKKRGGGPRTDPGKLRSRASSFHHGFRAKVVFSDDMAEAIRQRKAMLAEQFRPQTEYQRSLISDMAVARVKLDRAEELMPGNADRVVERALNFWDHDQQTAALNLAARLPKDPARFAHLLAGTKHGAVLMIERWDTLAQIARSCGDWDEVQRRMALDLLGIPNELQAGCAAIAPPGDKEALVALATGQAERLRTMIDALLEDQNAQNQADTIAGLLVASDTKLLRTYERAARRDYDQAHAELLRVQAEAAAVAREQEERERQRQWQDLSTPPSVPPEEQQASAAAARPRRPRYDVGTGRRKVEDAVASPAAEASTTEAGSDNGAAAETTNDGAAGSPNWAFYQERRRSAQRQAGPAGS
jgi:hypothetical protein